MKRIRFYVDCADGEVDIAVREIESLLKSKGLQYFLLSVEQIAARASID